MEWMQANTSRIPVLSRSLVFAQTFQAVAKAALQRRRSVGIESDEVPQRLAAIFAEPG